jgi:hypothetical protein
MAVKRVATGTVAKIKVPYARTFAASTFDPKAKAGKMKLYRKIVHAEVVEFMDVNGAGRFNTPIPSTRRI